MANRVAVGRICEVIRVERTSVVRPLLHRLTRCILAVSMYGSDGTDALPIVASDHPVAAIVILTRVSSRCIIASPQHIQEAPLRSQHCPDERAPSARRLRSFFYAVPTITTKDDAPHPLQTGPWSLSRLAIRRSWQIHLLGAARLRRTTADGIASVAHDDGQTRKVRKLIARCGLIWWALGFARSRNPVRTRLTGNCIDG